MRKFEILIARIGYTSSAIIASGIGTITFMMAAAGYGLMFKNPAIPIGWLDFGSGCAAIIGLMGGGHAVASYGAGGGSFTGGYSAGFSAGITIPSASTAPSPTPDNPGA